MSVCLSHAIVVVVCCRLGSPTPSQSSSQSLSVGTSSLFVCLSHVVLCCFQARKPDAEPK